MSPENSTPEWFQLAQADGYEPKPQKKRVLRIAALAAPLFVLGAGLVFAQTQDSPTAIASGVAASTSANAPASPEASSSPISLATPTAATATPSSAIDVSQTSSTTPSAQPSITIKKPAITMPTGGGEDDGLRSSDDD